MSARGFPIVRRPGPGWCFVGCSVWQHISGVRVHYLGMVLLPDGTVRREKESDLAKEYIRLAGGNRKRGLMMWALAVNEMRIRSRDLAVMKFSFRQLFGSIVLEHPYKSYGNRTS